MDAHMLRHTKWTDAQLRAIDTKELAALAFETSDGLKAEFRGHKSVFFAYWKSLRGT
jgi:hypothetical protein